MAKYKNIQELAKAFRDGELKDWILLVDNDNTYLEWRGDNPCMPDTNEAGEFEDRKCDEGSKLWDSPLYYILDQALEAAGIPNEGV